MAPATPKLSDYQMESVKPLHSTDGSPSGWVTIRYVKKDKNLNTRGCISASGNK